MHRAILVSQDAAIEAGAIMLSGTKAAQAAAAAAAAAKIVEPKPAEAPAPAAASPYEAVKPASANDGPLVGRTVADVERELIINTLDHCLGNRTHAANILGISIRTLRNKLKEYGDNGIAVPGAGG